MPFPPDESAIKRSLLRDDVFERLRDAIVAGELAPGEQLRDSELADRLGCSRTPVREALLRLGETGLVVARPGRSTVVSELDAQAVRDARAVVAGLHAVAVRQAVRLMNETDLEEMREADDRFQDALRRGDVEAAVAADDEFHGVPVRIAANPALESVLAQYTPVLRRAERLRFAAQPSEQPVTSHGRLVAACAAGLVLEATEAAYETWYALETAPEVPLPRAADA